MLGYTVSNDVILHPGLHVVHSSEALTLAM